MGYGLASLISLQLFHLFENLAGGTTVIGRSADFMAELATELSKQGNHPEATKATELASKFAKQESARLEEEQRLAEMRDRNSDHKRLKCTIILAFLNGNYWL